MSLNKGILTSGIRAAMSAAMSAGQALEGASNEAIESAAEGITNDLISACGSALESYLNGMIDASGDSVANVDGSACRAFFAGLFQFRGYEGNDHAAIAQSHADANWSSMFPFVFNTAIPPPGGISEITATSITVTALGSIASAYTTQNEDGFTSALADAIEIGAQAIQVRIDYLLATAGNPPAFIIANVT